MHALGKMVDAHNNVHNAQRGYPDRGTHTHTVLGNRKSRTQQQKRGRTHTQEGGRDKRQLYSVYTTQEHDGAVPGAGGGARAAAQHINKRKQADMVRARQGGGKHPC